MELVEVIKVNGRKKRFAERSEIMSVPLICPWSEPVVRVTSAGVINSAVCLIMTFLVIVTQIIIKL